MEAQGGKTCEEHQSMVKDKVAETEWKCNDVNEHWQQMKNIMMDTAQVTCGLSKSPCRHKETWWWNEEVAEAVREKRNKYGNWRKEESTEAWEEYKKSKQNTKKVISQAKGKKHRECARDLNDLNGQNEIFRIAKQMVKERQDIIESNCLKGVSGKVIVDEKD